MINQCLTSFAIHNQTNERIYSRNIPSSTLQPYINVRPVMTKYATMPIIDPRTTPSVPLKVEPTFSPYHTFNPGSSAPFSGYATNVNTESELRNQIYALQSCSQSVYVPSSTSDLYTFSFTPSNQQQPFPELFRTEKFDEFNPDKYSLATNVFNNCTRVNVKQISKSK